jgi:site-specific DNA-methyltransferase (adenine-specific)
VSRVEHLAEGVMLYLGDCLEVMPALATHDAGIFDPPYGLNLGKHEGAKDGRPKHLTKQGYATYEDSPENFLRIVVPAVTQAVALCDRAMVFASAPMAWALPAPTAVGGVYLPQSVGRNPWGFSSLAMCLLYGNAPDLNKGCKPTGFVNSSQAEVNGHPTAKPIEWMNWAVSLGSRVGETILDPFMGSGTTGVAAVKLGRNFTGIEIDPGYFDIACRRVEAAIREPDLFVAPPKPMKQEALPL